MSASLQLPKIIEDAFQGSDMATSRRNFLRGSGALVISLGIDAIPGGGALAASVGSDSAQPTGPYVDPDFRQLDTWIVIHPDNTATFFVGKTDGGQGTGTAFRQLMSDELDIPFNKTKLIMGRTDITPNQGGSGGSTAIERDSWPMRRVAAEARRVLLDLAAQRLGAPISELEVKDATVSVKSDPTKSVNYAELVGGKRFNIALSGKNIDATSGLAEVKPLNKLRMVGRSPQRYDIPAKVDGSLTWAVDVKLPGMVHARNVKPPVAGAVLQSVDESSIADIPGFVRIVRRGN